MSHRALNDLLFRFHETGLEDKLQRLMHIFKDDLPENSRARINNIQELFNELQNYRVIHIDNLRPLKEALGLVGRQDLVENVEELEKQRAEQAGLLQRYGASLQSNVRGKSARILSSAKWAGEKMLGGAGSVARAAAGGAGSVARAAVGAVNLKTVIRVGAAAVVGVTVYNICSRTPPEFFDEFSTRALPHGNTLIEMSNGCLCFTVQSEDLTALKALWDSYQEGTLKKHLQEFLVTEKIKQLAKSQEVEVDVTIDEQEYKDACLDLMAAKVQAADFDQEGQLYKTCRRNSDSTLYLKPMEAGIMSMSLKQVENKLNFERQRRQTQETENKNLLAKLMKASSTVTTGASVEQSFEDLTLLEKGAASLRRRRNSDSILYFRSMNAEEPLWQLRKDELHVPEGELKEKDNNEPQAEDMEPERHAYVQRYLEKLQETHSVTSETTDSGLGTQRAPSVLGTEEDSDISDEPRCRDLSGDVIKELSIRLRIDKEAWRNVCVALQLTGLGRKEVTLEKVISFFPETPVRLLKDVFDALQLFDLVELLENVKVNRSSLQVQRTLQEVRTLRKSDKRPTAYHSNVAVLIIYDPTEQRAENMEVIRKFFMDLNSDNDVTNIPVLRWMERERMKEELRELRKENPMGLSIRDKYKTRKQIRKGKEAELREMKMKRKLIVAENADRAALETVDRWLENQDKFTFFAVFDIAGVLRENKFMMEKLETLADKAKLIFTTFDHLATFGNLPETLLAFLPVWVTDAFLKILNKRWQTLDLCSMMEELIRTVGGLARIRIRDNMSRSVKFKKLEDKDSA